MNLPAAEEILKMALSAGGCGMYEIGMDLMPRIQERWRSPIATLKLGDIYAWTPAGDLAPQTLFGFQVRVVSGAEIRFVPTH